MTFRSFSEFLKFGVNAAITVKSLIYTPPSNIYPPPIYTPPSGWLKIQGEAFKTNDFKTA